jgi:LPXTG-site transpeptidase (sortase) family protein
MGKQLLFMLSYLNMPNEWNIPEEQSKKVRRTKIVISVLLSAIGILIILSQAIPLTNSYIDGWIEQARVSLMKNPVPDSYRTYIEEEFAYYDPGENYFANLESRIEGLSVKGAFSYDPSTNSNKKIFIDTKYGKDMYIDIESVGIEDIIITSNVESTEEKVYDQFLKRGVAHFKGTPLPGDGGNSFIYGHSSVESFFSRHQNLPETIFTRLEDIEVGDDVYINRDQQNLHYIVRKKKIVEATDFSILDTQGDKETVTLMTCWPLGIGTKRLVVVAEKY